MIRCATIGTNFVADWFMKAVQACDGITCSLVSVSYTHLTLPTNSLV